MTIHINRYFGNSKQTLGICYILNEFNTPVFSGISLERGWLDNQSNVSCIPKGHYVCLLEYSDKFKTDLWEIKNVPNRSECKFHVANYWHQLNGCIALGNRVLDMDKDGFMDIGNSGSTMSAFHFALKGKTRVDLIVS